MHHEESAVSGGVAAPAAPAKVYPDIANVGSDAVSYFTPAQTPVVAGTALADNPPAIFTPLKIRDVTFQNRIWLSPLCQYSADNGHLTAWHMAHLGGIASRGPGLTFVEATAVTPEGRITPQDTGMWLDSHADAAKPVVDFLHSQGQKAAIQLAHAGRKASTVAPFLSSGNTSSAKVGGWPDDVVAPSALDYSELFPTTKALSLEQIDALKESYRAAVRRSVRAGFDVIEIHAAHGYLLHEFLSPVSNVRTDRYGGSAENRARLLVEIVELAREEMPSGMPLFVRISATDWLDEDFPELESWTVDSSVQLAKSLVGKIDLLDVSSGGISPKQHMHAGPIRFGKDATTAYQAPFAIKIKEAVGDKMLVTAVGSINDAKTAESLVKDHGLDAVFVGRMFQKNPGLIFQFADELDFPVRMPNQISWAFKGRGKK